MKKIAALTVLLTIALTACVGTSYTVIDSDTLTAHPELKGVVESWQGMVDAAEVDDCETFLSYMRVSLGLDEEACPNALEFMADAPPVDWEKTEWNSTGGKAKIYELESGSITGFILNEATGEWGADELFWE
jgi:hypothetical protein